MYHHYFPEAFQRLNKEVAWHPELMKRLEKHDDFHIKLCEVAAYVLIAVDGEFTQEELEKLADLCVERLQQLPNRLNPVDQTPKIILPSSEDWSKFTDMSKKQ